jgi:TetR/AcrR family transcriptional regulator, fatty acid metabolism regulator protein
MARPKNHRAAILDAALTTFVKHGYHDTKVSDIAATAGVAEGTLYNYFDSKEIMLLALFDEKWGVMIDELKIKVTALRDPNDKLKTMFATVVKLFKKDRELAEIFLVDVKQSSIFLNSYTVNRVVDFIDLIEDILKDGKRQGVYRRDLDTKVAKMVIFGAAQGILLGWVLNESDAVTNSDFRYSLARAAVGLRSIFKYGL